MDSQDTRPILSLVSIFILQFYKLKSVMEGKGTEEIVAMIRAIKRESSAQDGPASHAKTSKLCMELSHFLHSEDTFRRA